MKKRLLLFTMCLILVFQCSLSPVNIAAKSNDSFFDELFNMVSEYWQGDYIESISLTVDKDTMLVNGEEQEIDPGRGTVPIIEDDRILLPIRAIVEALGGNIDYDNGKVIISDDETDIVTQVGSNIITVKGKDTTMDVKSKIENDRTMLPVRAITESLNCGVSWNPDSMTATITRDFQTKRLLVQGKSSNLDFERYNPVEVIKDSNNFYVLQFNTMSEA